MDGRLLAEDLLQLARVGRRDGRCVERAEPAPELERAGEGLLHRHLLVEDEPDQQRERLLGQERSASSSPVK